MDLKVIEEDHDARCVKARRTGEAIVPPADFAFPINEMTSGTQGPPVNQDPGDKPDALTPVITGSGSFLVIFGKPREPTVSEETRARRAMPDVHVPGPASGSGKRSSTRPGFLRVTSISMAERFGL